MPNRPVGADLSATSLRPILPALTLLLLLISITTKAHPQNAPTIPPDASTARHITVDKPRTYETSTATYPAHKHPRAGKRVLFVGNSLTYVNDLPAAFASLAKAGAPIQVDMIAFGGATLADHVARGAVASALTHGQYTDVILQERGGEAFCPAECQRSPDAALRSASASATSLAEFARRRGARVFYLGTWQADRAADASLEFGERRIATQAGATYIEVAEPRRTLLDRYPSFHWTRPDGQHPGTITTALMALRTWQAVYGAKATVVPCVSGPLHVTAPKPEGVWHVDSFAVPRTCLVSRHQFALLTTSN